MILLDTNVIRELTISDSRITPWLLNQDARDFRISVTSLAEINFGFHRLPAGRKRDAHLRDWLTVEQLLRDIALPISLSIAHTAGVVMAEREAMGRRVDLADAQIAATALVHRASLATRNTNDFDDLGIELVNPWEWTP